MVVATRCTMMRGAFPIEANSGFQVLPDLEVVNCKNQRQYVAVLMEGKKRVVMLVTAEGAEEINVMEDQQREPSGAYASLTRRSFLIAGSRGR
jgi:hypothetical protein